MDKIDRDVLKHWGHNLCIVGKLKKTQMHMSPGLIGEKGVRVDASDCAYCRNYRCMLVSERELCPIARFTGRAVCAGTPYNDVYLELVTLEVNLHTLYEAVKAEFKFLTKVIKHKNKPRVIQ